MGKIPGNLMLAGPSGISETRFLMLIMPTTKPEPGISTKKKGAQCEKEKLLERPASLAC